MTTAAAILLTVAACSGSGDSGTLDDTGPTSIPSIAPSTTTTTAEPTTTEPPTSTSSTTTTSTTTTIPATTTVFPPEGLPIDPEIRVPDGQGPFPVVVLVHGGGWVGGSPGSTAALARFLTEEGYLTINTDYQLAGDLPGFPGAINDVACAVRLARAHPMGDGTVTIVGHSAGAHIASVVALTGNDYTDGCPIGGDGVPDNLIGLSGPYDVDRLGILMVPFFGGGPGVEPEAWAAGNPHNLVGENVELRTLLLHGDSDGLVEIGFSFDFAGALSDAGSEALVEVIEGGTHLGTLDPDVVGNLILAWLER